MIHMLKKWDGSPYTNIGLSKDLVSVLAKKGLTPMIARKANSRIIKENSIRLLLNSFLLYSDSYS